MGTADRQNHLNNSYIGEWGKAPNINAFIVVITRTALKDGRGEGLGKGRGEEGEGGDGRGGRQTEPM